MSDYQEISDKYYEASSKAITAEYDVKRVLRYVYQDGFEQGVEWAINDMDNIWHRKTKDGGWTNWEYSIPPSGELIVTVYEDNCDNPYYYTTTAWYLADYWIHDNDILNGVVAWKKFPKPCKEK